MAAAADPARWPAAPARARRPARQRIVIAVILALIAAALVLRFGAAPLDRYDEGLTVMNAMLISDGAVPYRDFWTNYGPLDGLVLGLLFHLLGMQVLIERLLAAAVAILFTAASWWLTGIAGLRSPMRVLMTGLLAFVSVSVPALSTAVLADLIGVCAFACYFRFLDRRGLALPLACGALTGLAAFTRPEFAAVLALGLASGFGLLAIRRQDGARPALAGYLLASAATAAILWTPVVVTASWSTVYDILVVHTLTLYPQGRHIPLGQGPDAAAVLAFSGCFALIWVWSGVRALRRRRSPVEAARLLAPLLSAVLVFDWVLARADAPHAIGAWPLTAVLLAVLIGQRLGGRPPRRADLAVSAIGVALFCGAIVALAARDLARPSDPTAVIPRAALVGARAWIPAADLASVVRTIDGAAAPGQPIFVGLQHNDRVVFNDAMLYFLAGRHPGTRYEEYEPGLTTLDRVQRAITCQLARSGTTLAVLGPNTVGEPWNASSRPGSSWLDDWLTAHTVSRLELSPYVLLRLRLLPQDRDCQP